MWEGEEEILQEGVQTIHNGHGGGGPYSGTEGLFTQQQHQQRRRRRYRYKPTMRVFPIRMSTRYFSGFCLSLSFPRNLRPTWV